MMSSVGASLLYHNFDHFMLALWQVLVVTCLITTLLYMPLCRPEKNLLSYFCPTCHYAYEFSHRQKKKRTCCACWYPAILLKVAVHYRGNRQISEAGLGSSSKDLNTVRAFSGLAHTICVSRASFKKVISKFILQCPVIPDTAAYRLQQFIFNVLWNPISVSVCMLGTM